MRPSTRSRIRTINRLRWWHKYRISRPADVPAGARMRYVLWDPEIDTYSYELADPTAVVDTMASTLGVSATELLGYVRELQEDQELRARIRHATRFRPESKRTPPLGRHVIGYVGLRARRPEVALEAGIRHGLGSLVMLRALERNADDGADGTLVSIDTDPSAGCLVDRRNTRWEFALGRAAEVIPDVLTARRVGYALLDSVPDPAETEREVRAVLDIAQWPLIVQQTGWNVVTGRMATQRGMPWVAVREQPLRHWHPGRTCLLARFDGPGPDPGSP